MDQIVVTAGNALVTAMSTDAWRQAQAAVKRMWSRVRPAQQAKVVSGELESLRTDLLDARDAGDADVAPVLRGVWSRRLQRLVDEDGPSIHELLVDLVEQLNALLPADARNGVVAQVQVAKADDHSVAITAGQDAVYRESGRSSKR
ncbi:hypothetical protein [Phaeacidiphilus oryzae]|uniref:hypothetical protein n=1 Tax=Phaeacidiphilus oryzae TaxID=348818 RepID=UPI00126A1BCD|nr:hypothetical protein [Phaeacidiphilus oryzae]